MDTIWIFVMRRSVYSQVENYLELRAYCASLCQSATKIGNFTLQDRARIYRAALYWRVNLKIAARPLIFPLCDTRTPVRRQVFFVLNYTDYNRSPNHCGHVICATCHNSMAMTRPELEDVVGMEEVITPNRTKCSYCRQDGRYLYAFFIF